MRALELDRVVEFTSSLDEGTDEKTVWKLKPLDGLLMNKLGIKALTGDMDAIVEIVRYGVADVQGFLDADGHEIKPVRESIKIAGGRYGALGNTFLRRVPAAVLWEIGKKIIDISTLSAGEEKNSESPPGLPQPDGSKSSSVSDAANSAEQNGAVNPEPNT